MAKGKTRNNRDSGNKASGNNADKPKLGATVLAAGSVVTRKEATKIAKDTGKSVAQVMAKAMTPGSGQTLANGLVNKFNKGQLGANLNNFIDTPGLNNPFNTKGTNEALSQLGGLEGLLMGKGQVYAGAATVHGQNQPIVLPRNMSIGGGVGTGKGGDVTDTNKDGRIDANDLPAPNDGKFNHIIENIKYQGNAGLAESEYWKQKQIDDAAAYTKQLADLQAGADQNAAALKDMMIKQQEGFDQQFALQQQQLTAAQAAYQEQLRQTTALGKAYVPTLNATADAPISGDYRSNARTGSSSTLSSLSILSNASYTSPSLVGLQIA